MAVFTSGELAMLKPILRASAAVAAPVIFTVRSFSAPSPSFTTSRASSRAAVSSALANSLSRGSLGPLRPRGAAPARPVAASSNVSEVDVSPSTVMQLKLRATALFKSAWRIRAGKRASVKKNASMVAMSGAIMPDPLAKPLILTVPPP